MHPLQEAKLFNQLIESTPAGVNVYDIIKLQIEKGIIMTDGIEHYLAQVALGVVVMVDVLNSNGEITDIRFISKSHLPLHINERQRPLTRMDLD